MTTSRGTALIAPMLYMYTPKSADVQVGGTPNTLLQETSTILQRPESMPGTASDYTCCSRQPMHGTAYNAVRSNKDTDSICCCCCAKY